MSWIRDETGDLVNLDHVANLTVVPVDGAAAHQDDPFAVIATYPGEEHSVLYRGNEQSCMRFRDNVATKLPMVRL